MAGLTWKTNIRCKHDCSGKVMNDNDNFQIPSALSSATPRYFLTKYEIQEI
jgi:hypothetical protein